MVYPAAEVVEPGVVRHIALDRMPIGEPDAEYDEEILQDDAGKTFDIGRAIAEVESDLAGNLSSIADWGGKLHGQAVRLAVLMPPPIIQTPLRPVDRAGH